MNKYSNSYQQCISVMLSLMHILTFRDSKRSVPILFFQFLFQFFFPNVSPFSPLQLYIKEISTINIQNIFFGLYINYGYGIFCCHSFSLKSQGSIYFRHLSHFIFSSIFYILLSAFCLKFKTFDSSTINFCME